MKGNPEERCVALGVYIMETGATVRAAAQKFGVSKSTVHAGVTMPYASSGWCGEAALLTLSNLTE